jgi:hypothetical protein
VGSVELYVAENPTDRVNGTVRWIATVFTGASFSTIGANASTCLMVGARNPWNACGRVTHDGRFLAFETRMPVTADDRDTDGTSTCATPEIVASCMTDVFLYDAEADTIVRASVGENGPTGGRGNGQRGASLRANAVTRALNLTDSGSLFFQTDEQLVSADVNEALDVYAYAGGTVTLVSSGTSTDNSLYFGNTADGRDVFFLTSAGLAPRDRDAAFDLYDARVGGGFPEEEEPVCGALADGCQARSPLALPFPSLASGGPGGPNARPGPRARLAIRSLSAAARRRAARTGVIRLRVGTTVAGVVAARADAALRARRGSRTRRVANDRARARGAGTVTLALRLSKAARRKLRTQRRLRVLVRVTLPGARARARSVVLRLPKSGARSGASSREAR